MSRDDEARRATPLAVALANRIRREGPLGVDQYMAACLYDPEHGYYRQQAAIGRAGDFITAPEISQVFGELIGLWCVVVWQQLGAPHAVQVIELGPGRGTLMRDALRAVRLVPEFSDAAQITLVEISERLAATQRETLRQGRLPREAPAVRWATGLGEAPADVATIVIANEFLDALPVSQKVFDGRTWRTRRVALDGAGRLVFETADHADGNSDPRLDAARPGDIIETRCDDDWLGEIGRRAGRAPMAALLIDYGHLTTQAGDTLQAVRAHAYEHPLTSPGEADLTTQVDFADVAAKARRLGLAVDGPVSQGALLGSLGIVQRASRLMSANPALGHDIEAGVARLLSPYGMGARFKAIGLRSPSLSPLPGLVDAGRQPG